MSRPSTRPLIAAAGTNWQVLFRRNEGYWLEFDQQPSGIFDTLTLALAERDRLAYAALSAGAVCKACQGNHSIQKCPELAI